MLSVENFSSITMPKVSVIVPNYNHAQYLRQRIDSIIGQTYQDFELILLDDCSTDNSREVLESYRGNSHVSHIVFNETNGGTPFKQWNKGIELAQGEWIWIAESDDWAEPSFLESLLNKVEKLPQCGFAYTWTNNVGKNGQMLWQTKNNNASKVYQGRQFIKEKLLVRNEVDNVSECIFKKDLFHVENSPKYDWMKLCGDWLFYILLAEQTDVLEVQIPLSNYRRYDTNSSSIHDRKGTTYKEGIHIWNYLRDNNLPIKGHDAKSVARDWANNSRMYGYSDEINHFIRDQFKEHYGAVVRYHDMILFWRKIKGRK